jgi:predicted amidohydrolase
MITVATLQADMVADVRQNGAHLRAMMREAAQAGARLLHAPEGALSGYVKAQIWDWAEADWPALTEELEETAALAGQLGLWVALGCNHPLPGRRPQNRVHVISDAGAVVASYAKRYCSHTEITDWYTPGDQPVTFEVDGFRFGCAICIEVCFPELFAQYERLGVDAVLLSSYAPFAAHGVMARAHAATNCYWLSLSNPTACSAELAASLFGPDGSLVAACKPGSAGLLVNRLDRDDPRYQVALTMARPWRSRARAAYARF